MIIGLIMPTNAQLSIQFVESLLSVSDYTRVTQKGCSIPDNRNAVFERARILGEDLLFIDSDMVFTREQVERMESLLKTHDIVTGIAVMTYEGNPPAIFDEELKLMEPKKELFEVGGCGAAFLGISHKVLSTLVEPFTQRTLEKTGQKYGEDISFCMNARDNGFKIMCDPSLNIGHLKPVIKYYESK